LRHSNLHVTNKYLQATSQSKRLAQGKLVDAIARWLAIGKQINTCSVVGVGERKGMRGGRSAWNAYWTRTDPDYFLGLLQVLENMAGTTRLELVTSAVTAPTADVTD
jgi:hypothetical protein